MEQAVTPTPESQQAALKPVGYVCANNGSGGLQVCEKDAPGAMPIYASDIERATPVSESHAGLAEKLAGYWTDTIAHIEAGKKPPAMMSKTVEEVCTALRAHPSGGVSADAEWLRHLGNDLYAKGHLDRHEAEEIGRVADRYLRAHPAGGVSECETCKGSGMVGGFVNADSGYQDDPCPTCATPEAKLVDAFVDAYMGAVPHASMLSGVGIRLGLRNALRAAGIGAGVVEARPLEEWYEDMGDVLWWKFPVTEAPYVGSPICLGQTVEIAVKAYGVEEIMRVNVGGWPGYHTHFTPIPLAAAPSHKKE